MAQLGREPVDDRDHPSGDLELEIAPLRGIAREDVSDRMRIDVLGRGAEKLGEERKRHGLLVRFQKQRAQRRGKAVLRSRPRFQQHLQAATRFAKTFPGRVPPLQLQAQGAEHFARAVPPHHLLFQKRVDLVDLYQVFAAQQLLPGNAETDPALRDRRQMLASPLGERQDGRHVAVHHLRAGIEMAATLQRHRLDTAAQTILRLQKLAAQTCLFRGDRGGKACCSAADDDHLDMAFGHPVASLS